MGTNMPIKRFTDFLHRRGEFAEYMDLLVRNFNPDTVKELMCLDAINIGWDGKICATCGSGRTTTVSGARPGWVPADRVPRRRRSDIRRSPASWRKCCAPRASRASSRAQRQTTPSLPMQQDECMISVNASLEPDSIVALVGFCAAMYCAQPRIQKR